MIKNKYIDIAEQLEADIKSEKYQDRLPGVYRLAEKFNTSHITVSKAVKHLAKKGFVNIVGTKGAIITYTKSSRPRTNIICLIGNFSDINQNGIPIKTIVKCAEKQGIKTITFSVHQQEILTDDVFLDAFHVDGFIFMYSSLTPEIISKLKLKSIPFVSINRLPDEYGVHWVDHDNGKGWMALYQQLIDDGHKWIACLAETAPDNIHQQTFESAYKTIMKKNKVFDKNLFAGNFDADEFSGSSLDEKLTHYIHDKLSFFLSLKKQPAAIFCKSNKILSIAEDYLKKQNIKITLVTEVEENNLQANTYFPVSVWSEKRRAQKAFEVLHSVIEKPVTLPITKYISRKLVKN